MAYLSAEQILDAQDHVYEDVKVPEWTDSGTGACMVRVRGMSGTERDKFESNLVGPTGKTVSLDGFRSRLAAFCMVDDAGKRLFRSEAEIKRLGEKSAQALTRVCDVAMRLSAFTDDDVKELTGN